MIPKSDIFKRNWYVLMKILRLDGFLSEESGLLFYLLMYMDFLKEPC